MGHTDGSLPRHYQAVWRRQAQDANPSHNASLMLTEVPKSLDVHEDAAVVWAPLANYAFKEPTMMSSASLSTSRH